LICIFEIGRKRLFANHVFARAEGFYRLGIMQKGRSGNVNQIYVIAPQQFILVLEVRYVKPAGHRKRRFPMRCRHTDESHPGDLGKMLQRIKAKTAGPQSANSDSRLHIQYCSADAVSAQVITSQGGS
jgi:hypothetical protein